MMKYFFLILLMVKIIKDMMKYFFLILLMVKTNKQTKKIIFYFYQKFQKILMIYSYQI